MWLMGIERPNRAPPSGQCHWGPKSNEGISKAQLACWFCGGVGVFRRGGGSLEPGLQVGRLPCPVHPRVIIFDAVYAADPNTSYELTPTVSSPLGLPLLYPTLITCPRVQRLIKVSYPLDFTPHPFPFFSKKSSRNLKLQKIYTR